jgi:hypothetical protein
MECIDSSSLNFPDRNDACVVQRFQGGEVMAETDNKLKFEVKIDPIDLHKGLREHIDEFEKLIMAEDKGIGNIAKSIEKQFTYRFCQCCFFGKVEGQIYGEYLCLECAKELYGFDKDKMEIKRIDPYHQLWYRKKKSLPIFEAYFNAELGRWKAEQELEKYKEVK